MEWTIPSTGKVFQVEEKQKQKQQYKVTGEGEFVLYLSKDKAARAEWMHNRDMVVDKDRDVEEGARLSSVL